MVLGNSTVYAFGTLSTCIFYGPKFLYILSSAVVVCLWKRKNYLKLLAEALVSEMIDNILCQQ